MARQSKRIARVAAACLAFCCGAARADGLLHIANCRIVDDRGPIKAMGVNYVNGFWAFAKDGKREGYLPYLDALAKAKIPFIRMAFGPWAPYRSDKPPAPQIANFVANTPDYLKKLDTFLADARARRIGVVLDVFWTIDPYASYFAEPVTATGRPASRTLKFLDQVVRELARRHGRDPTIWMIEFENEGNLGIDFPGARHSRTEFSGLLRHLANTLRSAGDRHLIDSGNGMPRPAAENLNSRRQWRHDSFQEFLRALDAETPNNIDVTSIHLYPEPSGARPWDNGDILEAIPALSEVVEKTCRPLFVGEFGAPDFSSEQRYIATIAGSPVQIAAIWGFGRTGPFPLAFGLGKNGEALLHVISKSDAH